MTDGETCAVWLNVGIVWIGLESGQNHDLLDVAVTQRRIGGENQRSDSGDQGRGCGSPGKGNLRMRWIGVIAKVAVKVLHKVKAESPKAIRGKKAEAQFTTGSGHQDGRSGIAIRCDSAVGA